MIKKLFSLTNLSFIVLSVFSSFILGLLVAKVTGAGQNQMLAGGAIVLFYGMIAAFVGLLLSIVLAIKLPEKLVAKINYGLFTFCVLVILYAKFIFDKNNTENHQDFKPKSGQTTMPVDGKNLVKFSVLPINSLGSFINAKLPAEFQTKSSTVSNMGLGLFKPHLTDIRALSFLKDCENHITHDSILFATQSYGQKEIAYAPPWLLPEHLKLDYDIIYFKVVSISRNCIEIEVNKNTGLTQLVSTESGRVVYWPEFLLNVFSIEALGSNGLRLKSKPLEHASDINTPYSILSPIAIKDNWIKVQLLDDDLNSKAEAWVQWHDGNDWLISYSLLS